MKKVIWERVLTEENNFTQQDIDSNDEEESVRYGTAIDTGDGIFLLNNALHPLKQYNLWICHCNFWITQQDFLVLRHVEGVEVLRFMSPYRFLVGPGRVFDEEQVKKTIEMCLGVVSFDLNEIVSGIEELRLHLKSNFEKWAIYIFPNGRYEHITDKSKEYRIRVDLYKKCSEMSSGLLITHESQSVDYF